MNALLHGLPAKARRGSKPRCHIMTHGSRGEVAARLSGLIAPFGSVDPTDCWMPEGFERIDEAELHKAVRLLGEDHCAEMRAWWFAIFRGGRQTGPSFDIASTCTVTLDGGHKRGILLIEAKAHDTELANEERGKPLAVSASDGRRRNHERIGEAIRAANEPFNAATGFNWLLSHDSRYQMSNRFASACKLAELGYPVVLVYLGFLNAEEMKDQGKPLESPEEWDRLVKSHSGPLFPPAVWNGQFTLHGQPFVPLIRSVDQPL